ncbi:MAG: leucine-rich repeat domain-containing protein [Clostridia bacterium]|nr:leucine-rich repeat domain-containing protein [Clostridia bacterium]
MGGEKRYSEGLSYRFADYSYMTADKKSHCDRVAVVTDIGTCRDEHIIVPPTADGVPVSVFAYAPQWEEYPHYKLCIIDSESLEACYPEVCFFNDNLKSITFSKNIGTVSPIAFSKASKPIEIRFDADNIVYYSKGNCVIQRDHLRGEYDGVACGTCASVIPEDDRIRCICSSAFAEQEHLERIVIPKNITHIFEEAFLRSSVKSVDFSEGLQVIDFRAFHVCRHLESISLPSSICYVDEEAFAFCESLTEVTIPEGVTTVGMNRGHFVLDGKKGGRIGFSAFAKCRALKTIRLPNSLYYYASNAFSNCISVEKVYYNGTLAEWDKVCKPTREEQSRTDSFMKEKIVPLVCLDGETETAILYHR